MSKIIKKQLDAITTVRISADITIKQEEDFVILTKKDLLEIAEMIKEERKKDQD